MGGFGSGRKLSFSTKVTIEGCRKLDIATLKAEIAELQQSSQYTGITWKEASRIVDLNRESNGQFVVRFSVIRQHLAPPLVATCVLESTIPQFGGARWWFRCSVCERRCRIVYCSPKGYRFGCRACLRLSYRSQRVDRLTRLGVQIERLKVKLQVRGSDTAVVTPTPPRPKGMKERHYRQLLLRLRTSESHYWQEMRRQLQKFNLGNGMEV